MAKILQFPVSPDLRDEQFFEEFDKAREAGNMDLLLILYSESQDEEVHHVRAFLKCGDDTEAQNILENLPDLFDWGEPEEGETT